VNVGFIPPPDVDDLTSEIIEPTIDDFPEVARPVSVDLRGTKAPSLDAESDVDPELPSWDPGDESSLPLIRATPFVARDPATIPRREWVYGHHLIRKYISLTAAPSATGKSSALIADTLALVTGRDLVGIPVHGGPQRVWVWNLEDPMDELERRIAATMQHYGIVAADIGDRLFVDSGRQQGLCIARQDAGGTRIIEPVAEALESELLARRIDVLIIDPFVSSHMVPENDNGAIDAVAKRWGAIADKTNTAIELVHHLRKLGGAEATAESARGAVALIAAARSVRVLNRMTEDEAEKAGLAGPKGYFRVTHDKENLAPASNNADWFHIVSVHLANGDDVGVVTRWAWPNPFNGVTATHLLAVQHAVDGKGYRASVLAKDWVGHVVGKLLQVDTTNKGGRYRINTILKTWIENGALVRSIVPGTDRHGHPIIEVGKWATPSTAEPEEVPRRKVPQAPQADRCGTAEPAAPPLGCHSSGPTADDVQRKEETDQ
jgi:hypothetical protein